MALEGLFTIQVVGTIIKKGDVDTFVLLCGVRIKKIDPDVRTDIVNFVQMNYRVTWKGIPFSVTELEFSKNLIIRVIGKYFKKWDILIKINFNEQG
jgi:hypothetical protein